MKLSKNCEEMVPFFVLYRFNSYFCMSDGYIIYCPYSGG